MVVYQLPSPCKAGVRRLGCSSSLCLLTHCHGSWSQKPPSFLLWFPVKKMTCHIPVYNLEWRIGPIWLVHAQIWWPFGGDLHDECQLSSRRLSVSVFPVSGSLTAQTCSTAVPWRWPHLIYRTWAEFRWVTSVQLQASVYPILHTRRPLPLLCLLNLFPHFL